MKVILAGFSKTGTKSLSSALTELGYNVYDFIEHFWHHEKYWMKIFKDEGTIEDFKEMYQDVDAVVDVPTFMYWEEISEAFPEAKIILTIRDEESWVVAMKKQLDMLERESVILVFLKMLCPTIRRIYLFCEAYTPLAFGGILHLVTKHSATSRTLRKRYRQHNLNVMQNAPKDRLFVFEVKDGWGPLCKFLDKEVPETPFPWLNKHGDEIDSMIKKHPIWKQTKMEFIFVTVLLTVLMAWLIYKLVEKSQVYFF